MHFYNYLNIPFANLMFLFIDGEQINKILDCISSMLIIFRFYFTVNILKDYFLGQYSVQ